MGTPNGFAAGLCVMAVMMPGIVASDTPKEPVPMALKPFDLTQVRLLDGPCKEAQEANRRYLHELDENRLLHCFRANAGLEAGGGSRLGEPLGGWEAPSCEVRGHFVGHYLSACALMYASTGDADLKAKGDRMVAEFARCQKALGGEYLSAYPETFWDRLEALQQPPWAPYYTIHKIMAGLFDMYSLCGNEQALDVLKGMASYFKKRLDKLSIAQWDQILGVEFGGMAEVLYNVYSVTGDENHLALAHAFDKAAFLGPLALEHDNLTGLHANTHIPEIVGAARRYELLGDTRYRTAVAFFWDRIVNTRTYATGGTSNAEMWGAPNDLAKTLSIQNQESCTSYNMLRVTRHLLCWAPDPRYADYYERTFFNSILGTQEPATGMLAYFTPLVPGSHKVFGTPNDSFWCCYGTGIESFSKLGDSIYFHDDAGLYVNLLVASVLDWKERGVRIEQQTRFPEEEATTFVVHTAKPLRFALNVHAPYWTAGGLEVLLNRQPCGMPTLSGYCRVDREWSDGDSLEVRLPMAIHVRSMPDNPDLVAAMYGPLVLAGISEQNRWLVGDAAKPESWLEKVNEKPLTFRTKGQSPDVELVPLNRVVHEPYGVYFEVVKPGSARQQQLVKEEEVKRAFDARVVDRVAVGDEPSEKAHGMKGANTQTGVHQGRGWRHATPGGWWSWELSVLPNTPMTLFCTYWGSDVPPRTFDILVNDNVIATQSLDRNKPGDFFDVEYPIPPDAIAGKDRVTVTFRPHENNTAGGVFGCAILKPAKS